MPYVSVWHKETGEELSLFSVDAVEALASGAYQSSAPVAKPIAVVSSDAVSAATVVPGQSGDYQPLDVPSVLESNPHKDDEEQRAAPREYHTGRARRP